MSEKIILVPIDFTTVSDVSIGHAFTIGKQIKADLHLLHLVDHVDDIDAGKVKLEEFIEKSKATWGTDLSFSSEVKKGDILEDIGAVAEELKVELVVMATHGLQGIEYIVGTHAVRILATAQVPFIVVQERAIRTNGYENIIVPMDLNTHSKQKLDKVAAMAKAFDSKVHLVIPSEDDEFLQNALDRNLKYAETFFAQKGVEYTATMSKKDSSDLDEAVLNLAVQKDADLIAIMNGHESKIFGIFGGDKTQDILINKAMIPVMVLNPKVVSNFDLFGSTAVYN